MATTKDSSLRNRAERKVCSNGVTSSDMPSNIDDKKLLHELQVHQVELEMQNEELCLEQERSEISRTMYAELYDLAPIAYFTFDAGGVIQEVNNACTHLLEIQTGELVNTHFGSFIDDADERKIFADHLAMVLQRKVVLKCGVKLTRKDGVTILHNCRVSRLPVKTETALSSLQSLMARSANNSKRT
ncbi:MAG: PAS domain-containing protein [Desulfuromonadaceae bacterium]|nr:PAS domain-containing protein [Desulfuromonadaceae bacterium]MDD5106550.1 PAS domain-containing protein [Desulfuromonadaceae bacterium]